MSADIFKKIAGAKISGGGNYLRDGKYRLAVESFKMNQGHKGTTFIPEFRVKSAAPVEQGVEPNPVGSTFSCVWNVTKHDAALGNVKDFVLSIVGADESAVSEDDLMNTIMQAVGEHQPLRGLEIDCETYRKPIQSGPNAGKMMTLPRWYHVGGQTEETRQASIKELEAAPAAAPSAAPAQAPASAPAQEQAPPAAPAQGGGLLAGVLGKK